MSLKKHTKRWLSVLVAVIMLLTSIQCAFPFVAKAAGEDINPAFARGSTVSAIYDDEKNINITFSKADAKSGYHGQKTIKEYIVSLTDLTNRDTREDVLFAKVVPSVSGNTISTVINFTDIEDFYSDSERYNVSVVAVDNEGWRSTSLNTGIIKTPPFNIPEDYEPDTNGMVKYIMDMETSSGVGSNYLSASIVNNVDVNGAATESRGTGNNESYAYRFWFNGSGDNSKYTDVDFSYNRRAYNFVGTDGSLPSELLIWVDMTDVSIDDIDFRICYNDKQAATIGSTDKKSDLIYSTANYDKETTIYLTNEDGFWEKKTYSDGTISDLKNYRGIIRVPVKCFVNQDGQDLSTKVNRSYKNGLIGTSDSISPLEDVYSFGISFKAGDETNLHKAFYVDDIAFLRDDGVSYVNNSNESSSIQPISVIYDRSVALPECICQYIEEYIGETPSFTDKAAVENIENIMAVYNISMDDLKNYNKTAYEHFVNGRNEYAKFKNKTESQIVMQIEQDIYGLPNPENIVSAEDSVIQNCKLIYATYLGLNLQELRFLSNEAEDKLLSCYQLVYGTKDKVGSALATRPWIEFNNFDNSNYFEGMTGYDLFDDYPNAFDDSTVQLDKQHSSPLTHYSNACYITKTVSGPEFIDYYLTGETASLPKYASDNADNFMCANGVESIITDKGYNNTLGATLHFNRDLYNKTRTLYNPFRETATMAFSYNGNNGHSWSDWSGLNINNWTDKTIGDTLEDRLRTLSLAFYLDTTDVTGLDITLKICTDSNTYYLNNGKDANQRYIRVLDSETGEWKTEFLSSTRQLINGKTTDENGKAVYALDNFKGWVYVPLVYFKLDATGNALDRNNDLSNIKSIKFSVQHRASYYTDNDGASFKDKDITIDSVGFTYDPTYYTENAAARNDLDFDQIFEIESTDSKKFVMAVNAVNINNDDAQVQLENLQNQYTALSDYQKGLSDVKTSYSKLQKLIDARNNIQNPQYTPAQLEEELGKLSTDLSDSSLKDNALPLPLVLATNTINYGLFDTSAEELEFIKNLYDKTFLRFSDAQIAQMSDENVKKIKNAYQVYLRYENAKKYSEDYLALLDYSQNSMYQLVNVDGTEVPMTSIDDRTSFLGFMNKNTETSVYTKEVAQLKSPNLINGSYAFYSNSAPIKTGSTTTEDSALQLFEEKANTLYAQIDASIKSKTPITPSMISDVKDIIGEYNSFPDYYKNVVEIYQAVKALEALFPVINVDGYNVNFNSSTLSVNENINVSYVAALSNLELYLGNANTFTLTSDDSKGDTLPFEVTLGTGSKAGDKIGEAENSAEDTENPGTALAQAIPISIKIADGANIQPKQYSGSVLVTVGSGDGETVLSIPVTYSDTESYVVSIPADQSIPFGSQDNDIGSVSVDLNLTDDKSLTVSLENPTDRKLKLTQSNDVISEIPYDLTVNNVGFSSFVYTMANKDTQLPLNIAITDSSWKAAFVNEYSDTLTFSVNVTGGA